MLAPGVRLLQGLLCVSWEPSWPSWMLQFHSLSKQPMGLIWEFGSWESTESMGKTRHVPDGALVGSLSLDSWWHTLTWADSRSFSSQVMISICLHTFIEAVTRCCCCFCCPPSLSLSIYPFTFSWVIAGSGVCKSGGVTLHVSRSCQQGSTVSSFESVLTGLCFTVSSVISYHRP